MRSFALRLTAMNDVYYKTLILILTIALGCVLHHIGIFDKSDAQSISKIMMNITLPCVVVKNLNGITLSLDILAALIVGFAANLIFLSVTFLFAKKGDPDDRVVKLFCFSSFNIGNYAIPILSTFVDAPAMAGVLAFNYPGTAVVTYGTVPVIGKAFYGERGASPLEMLRKNVLRNVPTVTCLVMLLLCLFHIALPESVAGVFSSIASANTTLAMLSIGILLDFKLPRSELVSDLYVVLIRFCTAILCGAAILFLLPASQDLRRALTLCVFAPISSAMPVMALHCGYQGSRVAVINSIYLLVSICAMSLLILLLY